MDMEALKEQAMGLLDQGKENADKFLEDGGKMDQLLEQAEKKLSEIPKAGEYFAEVPRMIALLKDRLQKDYDGASKKSLLAIVAALLYLVNPKDLIPDKYIGIGQLDDAAVIAAAVAVSKNDLDAYAAWRDANKKA